MKIKMNPLEIESELPGADLVKQGLSDLAAHLETANALLICIGAYRLRAAGIDIPDYALRRERPEHALYDLLGAQGEPDPFSAYNALIRRLVSFERTIERQTRRLT